MRIPDEFHVSLLDKHSWPVLSQPTSEPQQTIIDDVNQWEVECILECKRPYRRLHYLVQ
jgi:hypothetical protein